MRCPICKKPTIMEDDILCSGCNERVYACTCLDNAPSSRKSNGATVSLDEAQRQLTLLALAKLGIERPGFVWALEQIALKMDERVDKEHARMFREFLHIHERVHPPDVSG